MKHVLDGVHTGVTRRIPFNCPSAAAMRPVVKFQLILTAYFYLVMKHNNQSIVHLWRRFVSAVASWFRSMKLLHVGPGWYRDA